MADVVDTVGFFVGCNTAFNRPDLESAVRYAFPALGVELDDLEGQSCCPSWGTMPSVDEAGWCAVSARNYVLAEEKAIDIVTVCGSCYGSMAETRHKLRHDPELRERVNDLLATLGKEFRGTSDIIQAPYYLHRKIGPDAIAGRIKHRLSGMRIAVQPGCHALWPSEVYTYAEQDTFHPVVLRELCEALGASAPAYSRLTDCCGMGGMRSTDPEKSLNLVRVKLQAINEEVDPDLIVTGCSSCLIQLDTAQALLQKEGAIDFGIPVLHYMQLLAVCLGADPVPTTGLAKSGVERVVRKIRGDEDE
ncbi:MAG: CoB--CoM heterodisulfide reductase iron-sulfur subunit B family protein [Peptococcaceae bacterium]|jgi:heterodisulfide reductase subunit B|nr:CoB--CoM heterodisulfide reductase iron-sulfur subunit B family protein [Peptococcaceae bacterium]